MKNFVKLFGIVVSIVTIGVSMVGCDMENNDQLSPEDFYGTWVVSDADGSNAGAWTIIITSNTYKINITGSHTEHIHFNIINWSQIKNPRNDNGTNVNFSDYPDGYKLTGLITSVSSGWASISGRGSTGYGAEGDNIIEYVYLHKNRKNMIIRQVDESGRPSTDVLAFTKQ